MENFFDNYDFYIDEKDMENSICTSIRIITLL